jgi:hypothetical protein
VLDIENITPMKNRELRVYSETKLMGSTRKVKKDCYINYSSYEQAIKLLKSVKQCRIPFEKMMIIANISTEITESVNSYWKDMELFITNSMLNIDADELITIFIYIIIKSQMSDILIHSKFIKEFTTSSTRSTMLGFYYTTLEASLIYILDVSDISELKKEKRPSRILNMTTLSEIDRSSLIKNINKITLKN